MRLQWTDKRTGEPVETFYISSNGLAKGPFDNERDAVIMFQSMFTSKGSLLIRVAPDASTKVLERK